MAILSYGRVDIRAGSYSRNGMLHQCPRKYELEQKFRMSSQEPSVTFSFGHMVGRGVQSLAEGKSKERAIFDAMLEWDMDIYEPGTMSEQRALKSFWWGIHAIQQVWELEQDPRTSFLDGWEVAMLPDNEGNLHSGVELEFRIDCGADEQWEQSADYDPSKPAPHFLYEGHIDLLVINKEHTKLRVVELKTNSSNQLDPAQYQNSSQASGYAVLVDRAAQYYGIESAYEVLYIVFMTKLQEWRSLPFLRTFKHRIEFLLNIMADKKLVQLYNHRDFDHWPMNGSACFDFFRPCRHLDTCMMSRPSLMALSKSAPLSFEEDDNFGPFRFTIEELMQTQQDRAISFIERVE